ncbi:MAG TPA: TIGR04282 family arsenosugar biosynthesis glycosyltransferase [Planctomycetaceae bacterium]|nr:TIGR04282 family arsenosugar biosynthesis glycosyltransferase [Planctomycetaceae bacterium]
MRTLGLFAKFPEPGRVKTRLAESIGPVAAAELAEAMTADLLDRFRLTADRRWLGYSPATPDAERHFRQAAGPGWELWPQPEGDLGSRMHAFFATANPGPRDVAVLIGSDSPTLPEAIVAEAFTKLRDADCVLGPATDGGYYLIGCRGAPPAIFTQVNWSQPTVLSQTVERGAGSALRLAELPPWYDIDTRQDLQMLAGHLRLSQAAGGNVAAPKTAQVLERILTTMTD